MCWSISWYCFLQNSWDSWMGYWSITTHFHWVLSSWVLKVNFGRSIYRLDVSKRQKYLSKVQWTCSCRTWGKWVSQFLQANIGHLRNFWTVCEPINNLWCVRQHRVNLQIIIKSEHMRIGAKGWKEQIVRFKKSEG